MTETNTQTNTETKTDTTITSQYCVTIYNLLNASWWLWWNYGHSDDEDSDDILAERGLDPHEWLTGHQMRKVDHCSQVQRVALHCITLHWIVLNYTALHCIVLHFNALHLKVHLKLVCTSSHSSAPCAMEFDTLCPFQLRRTLTFGPKKFE